MVGNGQSDAEFKGLLKFPPKKYSGIESFRLFFFFSEKLKMCLQRCYATTVDITG